MKSYQNLENKDYFTNSHEDYMRRAYRLQMEGRVDDAIECYHKSIAIRPTAEAHTFLGWALSFKSNFKEAIDECQKAIEIDPDFGNAPVSLAGYLIQLGRLEEAIIYLKAAMKCKRYTTPHFPHYNLGRIYERQGYWFEAKYEYEQALEIEPSYSLASDAWYKLVALLQ